MQASIDRVLRTFTLKPHMSFAASADDRQTEPTGEESTAFAAGLLDNYKSQLARRSAKHD